MDNPILDEMPEAQGEQPELTLVECSDCGATTDDVDVDGTYICSCGHKGKWKPSYPAQKSELPQMITAIESWIADKTKAVSYGTINGASWLGVLTFDLRLILEALRTIVQLESQLAEADFDFGGWRAIKKRLEDDIAQKDAQIVGLQESVQQLGTILPTKL